MVGSSLVEILDGQREDSCSILRVNPEISGSLNRNGTYEEVKKDVRCHLSIKSSSVPDGSGRYQVINIFQVFMNPELEINQGDRLIVTKQGISYILTTGKPIRYKSHLQVICQEVENV